MEVSGVVLRQIPSVSGAVADGRYSGLRSVSKFSGNSRTVSFQTRKFHGVMCNNEFADKEHMNYYFKPTRCGGEKEKVKLMEKEKKALKKKAKVLKSLSKNLNMFSSIGFGLNPEAGLVSEIQNKSISEATEILVKQLEQLKAEEKLLKKQRKEEKAKAKAMKMTTDMDSESSSSSSESSDSDCGKGKVVDMNTLRNKEKPILEPLQPESTLATLPRIQETLISNKKLEEDAQITGEALQLALLQSAAASTVFPLMANPGQRLKTVEAVSVVGLPLKRVEVCMGGKCKKSGGAVLLNEFQRAMTGMEGSAVACKCMGKCRDGPNVRVVNETYDSMMTDSVKTPSKTVCVGVGLQDVETIVTSFFGEESSREGLGYVSY
ncbi:hypothetical protein EUTSA_v10011577mg [Eutrema salsugineum]|uniref:Diacylglycerol O-acyltransferase 3, cytosolic n=1 Tax=Eutrema salsugineum TaxID=72664 RepID=V4KHQ7_EUTSA|nr:diacylglycerol O-acyltransferase 3, cytosolic [Eutrema salsugineum]ESQ30729.1 hypothetical protein EUTSA_v10011577mg [Eutrema salsugineum]